MTSTKPPSFVSTLSLLCSGLLLLTLAGACESKKGPALPPATGKDAPPPPSVPNLQQLAKDAPAQERVVSSAAGTGTLRPRHEAALGPKETGLITAIAVDEGDSVKKGQILFRLDSVQAGLAVDQARAAVATVQVQVDAAQLDFDRTKALRERGSVPADALDQVKSRLDAASSSLRQAKAALSVMERHATNMVQTAPFDGVVTERRMNVGETATLMPPSVVMVVQDLESLELRARLPESALREVQVGSEITVRFPSVDQTRTVKVKRIAPTIDARTRTIEIIADVDNKDRRLLVGMLAEVMYGDGSAAKSSAAAKSGTVKNEQQDAERALRAEKEAAR
jgi:RND family efflux transporter MFP subunit